MDFNLPEEMQRRICFALIPAKSLCWPPKLSHYPNGRRLDIMRRNSFLVPLVLLSAFFPGALLFAQDAKLIEAAKKEGGKVVVYGSIENGYFSYIFFNNTQLAVV
jgi:hypothetical protein